MEHKRLARIGTAVIATVLALTLAACASRGSGAATGKESATPTGASRDEMSSSVAKSVPEWSMPLDQYKLSHPHRNTYAEHLGARSCVAENGYVLDVPWQDPAESVSPTINGTGQRLFTVEIAQKWGYHSGQTDSVSSGLWDEYVSSYRDLDRKDAFNAMLSGCIDDVRARNPLPNMDDQMFVHELSEQARHDATQDLHVRAAAALWSKCMAESGLTEIPDSPEKMPTNEMIEKFEIGSVPVERGTEAVISVEEIAIATKQADCEKTSGYREVLYRAQWDLEAEFLVSNAERLRRIKNEVVRYHDGVDRLIEELAPAAP